MVTSITKSVSSTEATTLLMRPRSSRVKSVLIGLAIVCSTVPSQASHTGSAEEIRLNEAVRKLGELAKKQVDDKAVVGMAVGVIYKDRLLFAKGFGPREAGKEARIDPDTVFQLASVSKPISATVVASLVGDGKISWDSKICDLDPGFEMFDAYPTREITIRDLYAHRSGLPEHAGDLLEDMGYKRADVLHRLRYQRPDSSFRSHYAYTNFGLTEGAVAAAKAYGLTWEDASEEKLYKPLGMNSTSSRYSVFASRENRAAGHVLVDGKWVHKYKRDPDAQSPAGGVSSSINDLAKWMRLRLAKGKFEGKQIVAEKPLLETEHPHMLTGFNPFTGLPNSYGLGMNVSYDQKGRLHLGHSGAFALGNATSISMVPSEQLGVMVLTNSYPVGVAEALTTGFIEDALEGKQSRDWFALFKKIFSDPVTLGLDKVTDYSKLPSTPSAALKNEAYIGMYSNELFGPASIIEEGNQLSVVLGPSKTRYQLKHYDRDTFTYLPPGENSPGASGISFTIGSDGRAMQMIVENLNEHSQGVFTRN